MQKWNCSSLLLAVATSLVGCGTSNGQKGGQVASTAQVASDHSYYSLSDTTKLNVPLSEWKKVLPSDLFHVAFEKGTERPFTGKFKNGSSEGVYRCAVCGNALFDPRTKFESGTGWPSFYQPLNSKSLFDQQDLALGMVRDEVVCRRCGAHLGHVFDDGPPPTGSRYCINAVSLDHLPR